MRRAILRKVSLTSQGGGNRRDRCARSSNAIPFLRPIKEEILLVRDYRTTKVIAEIVKLQLANGGREKVARIECVVPQELITSSMIIRRTRFHGNDDLTSGAAAVFRHISGGYDVDFADRVHARSGHHGAVGTSP